MVRDLCQDLLHDRSDFFLCPIGLVFGFGSSQMSQRIEGGGLQVVGELAMDFLPSLVKARQPSPFVPFQGVLIICLQRSDVGTFTLRLLASCFGEFEEVQAQFELLFSGCVRPEGMDVSHSNAPVGKSAVRFGLPDSLENPACARVGHVVKERDTALHEALRGFTARDRQVYGAELVAIIIHQPGDRPAGNERKRNEKKSCKDMSHPAPWQRRRDYFRPHHHD